MRYYSTRVEWCKVGEENNNNWTAQNLYIGPDSNKAKVVLFDYIMDMTEDREDEKTIIDFSWTDNELEDGIVMGFTIAGFKYIAIINYYEDKEEEHD